MRLGEQRDISGVHHPFRPHPSQCWLNLLNLLLASRRLSYKTLSLTKPNARRTQTGRPAQALLPRTRKESMRARVPAFGFGQPRLSAAAADWLGDAGPALPAGHKSRLGSSSAHHVQGRYRGPPRRARSLVGGGDRPARRGRRGGPAAGASQQQGQQPRHAHPLRCAAWRGLRLRMHAAVARTRRENCWSINDDSARHRKKKKRG